MKRASAKHAKATLDRSIDTAIKSSKEFEATLGPVFDVANVLIRRTALSADLVDGVASALIRRSGDRDAITELQAIARKLRDAGSAARKTLG